MTRHQHQQSRTPSVVVGALALTGSSLAVMGSVAGVSQGRQSEPDADLGSLSAVEAVEVRLDGTASSAATMALLDVEDLVPGALVDRCIRTVYRGVADDATVRLSGQRDGGASIAHDLAVTIEAGEGDDPACDDFVPERALYAARLGALWVDHPSYEDGITVLEAAGDRDEVTVRISVVLTAGTSGQHVNARFWFLFEARP